MLSRASRGMLIAVAAGVVLALLFKAMIYTPVGLPYQLIGLVAVGIAWVVDYWLERRKRKEEGK